MRGRGVDQTQRTCRLRPCNRACGYGSGSLRRGDGAFFPIAGHDLAQVKYQQHLDLNGLMIVEDV